MDVVEAEIFVSDLFNIVAKGSGANISGFGVIEMDDDDVPAVDCTRAFSAIL